MLTFYTTDDGKCNPETSIVLILIWIKMANFKSVVLFLKIISLFIVQRNFGNVFYYENNLVYSVYISDDKFENCMDLLMRADKK